MDLGWNLFLFPMDLSNYWWTTRLTPQTYKIEKWMYPDSIVIKFYRGMTDV